MAVCIVCSSFLACHEAARFPVRCVRGIRRVFLVIPRGLVRELPCITRAEVCAALELRMRGMSPYEREVGQFDDERALALGVRGHEPWMTPTRGETVGAARLQNLQGRGPALTPTLPWPEEPHPVGVHLRRHLVLHIVLVNLELVDLALDHV